MFLFAINYLIVFYYHICLVVLKFAYTNEEMEQKIKGGVQLQVSMLESKFQVQISALESNILSELALMEMRLKMDPAQESAAKKKVVLIN